ncbi:uncharacterized protein Z519_01166 [Cladophialophora bantiana CBS 173.52]|uniref:Septin-type G domain-containing protein n=1 Tax=Cladophialophora bantiana (strain ATCC 10958 / CBS 173.52 / CDC B-1940 / NIH 8579) TaxID=1442370 RepID=A0A0D2GGW5_CLAB1|nr:uncharacterized protein Z519_01166 [Cladophialophora bantiana CBS 173.52]KIW97582.1 hypothetical protein Z519_01166 [Cladophialophora bantiana CBS 173.52]
MRPGIGLDNSTADSPRPRKPSNADSHSPSLVGDRERHSNPATTFFLSRDPDASVKPHQSDKGAGAPLSVSPLSSLQDTIEEADRDRSSTKHITPRQAEAPVQGRSGSRRRSTIKPGTNCERFRRGSPSANADTNASSPQPVLERVVSPSPLPSRDISLPGSPKSLASRRSLQTKSSANSDDELLTNADETSSQAILSSGDEDENETGAERVGGPEMSSSLGGGVQDSHPELIMPSIKMPSRRPFTQRGKRLGRFKIMVAGRKGVGKTSLIKSIVQLCEDIVHVDPLNTSYRTSTSISEPINEVYASTKPYPEWWSTIEESRILRRRKSMGDSVLERNICFVDTADSVKLEMLIHYAEQQLVNAMMSVDQLASEFSGLLSGRGASQVDVILYLISKDTVQDDCDCIRQLSELCNIIPLIAKSDLLTIEDQQYIKQCLDPSVSSLPRLPTSLSSPAALVPSTLEPTQPTAPAPATAPYTVTSTNGPDLDTMDASLLMSPEYIQPLLPSELSLLVESIFEPETVAYLRHTAARKLVAWHSTHPRLTSVPSPSLRSQSYNPSMRNSTLTSPLQTPLSTSNSGVLIPIGSEVSLNTSNSWALAKVADHTQREERLAQIRLSKWASELQLSLQRERERYERLARGERAVWLVERMGEEVRDGTIVPLLQGDSAQALVRKGGKGSTAYGVDVLPSYQMHDPLGLLRWRDSMRTRGWIALQIVGSFGVVGGLAFWLAKHFGATGSVNEWWTQGWHYFGWHD